MVLKCYRIEVRENTDKVTNMRIAGFGDVVVKLQLT